MDAGFEFAVSQLIHFTQKCSGSFFKLHIKIDAGMAIINCGTMMLYQDSWYT
jgi:hypothetical protein